MACRRRVLGGRAPGGPVRRGAGRPQALRLSGTPLVAQAIALRGVIGVAAVLGATAAAVALLRPGGSRRVAYRRRAVVAAGWCLVVAAGQVVVLSSRGVDGLFGSPVPPAAADQLVVLALNTQGTVSGSALARFVAEREADVVALPETTLATAEAAAALLDGHYRALAATGTGGANPSTAALVAVELGRYRVVATALPSTFTATGDGPPLTIVHTRAPVDPDLTWWSQSTRAAVGACATHPGGIVAGDFNATLDHPAFAALSGCVDAASVAGVGGVGTWPSALPRVLGTPIDHVLVDPELWQVRRAAVLDPPAGTDHRALEVVLGPASS